MASDLDVRRSDKASGGATEQVQNLFCAEVGVPEVPACTRCATSQSSSKCSFLSVYSSRAPPNVATVFKSTHHPGNTPWGIVYTRYLARPLGVCTVPLMIGATTSALLDQSIWYYLVWGLPAAIILASAWTHFSLSRTIAEIGFRSGQAALRSVQDVLVDRPLVWKPIFNVRTTSWHVELSVSRATYELQSEQWPEFEKLEKAARQSFQAEASSSPSSYA